MAQSGTRRARQSAVRIFAQEYSEASLIEQGVGEYDPSFVITKIGARVNRCLVSGVIERLERRDADSGPYYSGQIRDPSGAHYFNVAAFQPELHADVEELLARFDSGDRFLITMVGRARWNESEEGGVFTSIRAEDFAVIDQDTYRSWLVEASDATLRRLDAYSKSLECESEESSLREAGVPEDLVSGLSQSRGHYPEFDTEAYRMWVLKALSAASGKSEEVVSVASEAAPVSVVSSVTEDKGDSSPREAIISALSSTGGELVDYDSLVGACVSSGCSREEAEDAIEHLRDVSMEIAEPRFGYFSMK
jgi:hypothetical protein|tara:strand:+ start:171 stop:1091 length:921 start_codon:yes stop_codon:yes gene_type:complete